MSGWWSNWNSVANGLCALPLGGLMSVNPLRGRNAAEGVPYGLPRLLKTTACQAESLGRRCAAELLGLPAVVGGFGGASQRGERVGHSVVRVG